MSQLGNTGAPTPRRSGRISNKASSVAETAITTVTSGGTRTRRTGPLTKVKARKSNAYGASGRVGAAEALTVTATGFAQAFQNQRGDAFARDDEDDEGNEEDDSVDELAASTPRMSGGRNGRVPASSPPRSPSPGPEVPSMSAPGLSFLQSEDVPASEDETAASVGNTSKSFGPLHEAGMMGQQGTPYIRFSSTQATPEPTPTVQKAPERRNLQSQARVLGASQIKIPLQGQGPPPVRPTYLQTPAPGRPNGVVGAAIAKRKAIEDSVDALLAEEQARLARDGPPRPQPRSHGRRPQGQSPQAVNEWLGNVEPPQKDEAEWPWRKYLTWAFWALAAFMFLGWLGHFTTSPNLSGSETSTNNPGFLSAVNARVSYTFGKVTGFIQPTRRPTIEEEIAAFRAGDDNVMWRRMYMMNQQFEDRINGVHSTIDELRTQLPELLIVQRHEDGRSEISDDFWQALQAKLRSKEDSPEWREYLSHTKQKLDDILDISAHRDDTKTRPQAVSKQEFLEIIDKRFRELSTRVNLNIEEAVKSQTDQFSALVSAEAKKAMIDSVRLQSLAQTNLVANYELHLKAPNYFSTGLGAVIEPRLTSATRLDRPRWLSTLFQKVATAPLRNPPQTALTEWKQPGDCWCSAPNIHGGAQAQLTVALGRPMTPKKVTIEHVPMSMVPARDVSNAPRNIELWVETDEPVRSYYSQRQGVCGEGLPGWKCLGSFKYNIHASNHVQTFDLYGEPSDPIKRAMLRVTSNWGGDHTCLYQVRLHGDDAKEDYEYKVRLND
ncbi:hypothetical protein NX059_000626 [Plenodomus lindquistii]|nr:hypothetical protein NX059_000626 [Plenodomus lindquistii]